jgi:signal-transduction protein with cAMP-binding, CBS, and nucleotidyltransferase domain
MKNSLFKLFIQRQKLSGASMKPISKLLTNCNLKIFQVGPSVTVFEALRLLAEYGVGAMVVIENGKLVGVVSERDYTRKVALQGRNSKETTVADIMTRDVIMVTPQTGTRDCMTLMSQKKIRHLPVVEGELVVGLISMRHIMDDIIADHEETISQLTSYISN